MAPLETKLIFQGPIFHFHDYGRKGLKQNWFYRLYVYIKYTYAIDIYRHNLSFTQIDPIHTSKTHRAMAHAYSHWTASPSS